MEDEGEDNLDPERPPKRNYPRNYDRVCLWKILSAQIKIFSLVCSLLFSEEQEGRHKRIKGTGNLLYIDLHIFNEVKTRQRNVALM